VNFDTPVTFTANSGVAVHIQNTGSVRVKINNASSARRHRHLSGGCRIGDDGHRQDPQQGLPSRRFQTGGSSDDVLG
jgi:hypothetical protein